MHAHEVVIQADVRDLFVVHLGLETNCSEVWQIYCALHLDLTIAPTKFRLVTDTAEWAGGEKFVVIVTYLVKADQERANDAAETTLLTVFPSPRKFLLTASVQRESRS